MSFLRFSAASRLAHQNTFFWRENERHNFLCSHDAAHARHSKVLLRRRRRLRPARVHPAPREWTHRAVPSDALASADAERLAAAVAPPPYMAL